MILWLLLLRIKFSALIIILIASSLSNLKYVFLDYEQNCWVIANLQKAENKWYKWLNDKQLSVLQLILYKEFTYIIPLDFIHFEEIWKVHPWFTTRSSNSETTYKTPFNSTNFNILIVTNLCAYYRYMRTRLLMHTWYKIWRALLQIFTLGRI